MKNTLITGLMILVFLFIIVGIGYGGWGVKRWFNYKMSYSDKVQEQVDKVMKEHIDKYHKER